MSYYSPVSQKRSTPARTSAASLPQSRSPSVSPTVNRKRNTANSGYSDHCSIVSSSSTKTYPKKGTTLADAHLSPEEQQHLEDVLARYDQFRQIEDARVKHIRQELIDQQKIRIRNSEKSGEGRCDNCNVVFVPLFQPANTCFNCHGEFCRTCIRKLPQDNSIMCKFCYFESMNKCKLGVWFTEQLKIARAAGRVRGVSGPEALRSSILRLQRESKAQTLFQDTLLSNRESHISKTDSLFPVSDKDVPETDELEEGEEAQEAGKKKEIKEKTEIGEKQFIPIINNIIITNAIVEQKTQKTEPDSGIYHTVSSSDCDTQFQFSQNELISPKVISRQCPLEASTAISTRNLKATRDCNSFEEREILSVDNIENETHITSIHSSENILSFTSELHTPENQSTCYLPLDGMMQGDSVGAVAEAHLEARRRLRRVRSSDQRPHRDPSPSVADSGYVPPRTETWLQNTTNHPPYSNPSTKVPPSPSIPPSERTRLSVPQPKGRYSPTLSDYGAPSESNSAFANGKKGVHASYSDLRDSNIPSRHKKRLDSDAGSRSNLSVASANSLTDSEIKISKPISQQTSNLPCGGLHLIPVRRRSSSLDENDFMKLRYGNKHDLSIVDELGFENNLFNNPIQSFRSLRHLNTVRFSHHNASHGSNLSMYSEREESYTHGIPVTGDILMAVFYEDPNSTLRIAIKQARDIAAADKKHHTSNPYVKAYLLPDKTKASKRKTSNKKATCNPIFDEDFKYRIPKQDLGSRSLQISVWHHNSFGVNLFLGEVILPLAFHQFDQTPLWYPLGERRQINLPPEMQIYRGEVLLALKLVPGSAGSNRCEIHVWIKSAKGLTTSTTGRISKKDDVDPYAKIYLLPDKNKNSKQKTKVIKKSNNPEWNQAIIYRDIVRNTINEIGIEVSIWDHDRFSSNDFLGGCRLNSGSLKESWMDAVQTEKSVWLAMIERPNSWVEGSIRLRANLS